MDTRLIPRFTKNLLSAVFASFFCQTLWHTGAIAETRFPPLQGWTFNTQEQSLAFQADIAAQPSVFVLREPSRIVVDIKGTSWAEGSLTRSYSGKIGTVRIAEFTEGVTRFVLETSDPNATLSSAAFKLRSFPTDSGATLWQLTMDSTAIDNVNAAWDTTHNNNDFPPALLPPVIRDSVTVPSPPIPNSLRK